MTVSRTHLVLPAREALREGPAPRVPAALVELAKCTVPQWRALYRQVGYRWHWHDRDRWSDERLAGHLANGAVRIFRLQATLPDLPADTPAGFLELARHDDGAVEIVYLGLDDRAVGHRLGAWLDAQAVHTAFAWGATCVVLNTCTLDAPAALPTYLARGFTIEREELYRTVLTH